MSLNPKSKRLTQGTAFTRFDQDKASKLKINGKKSSQKILKQLSHSLLNTFKVCNSEFKYNINSNPRRSLTTNNKGVSNNNHDNSDGELILYVNSILGEKDQQYVVIDLLGSGTFGQVVNCRHLYNKQEVAIKVIKNLPAFFNQALTEIEILKEVNRYGNENKKCIKFHHHFMYKNHLCLVFECLYINLFEVIQMNKYKGLTLNLVRSFTKQTLEALHLLYDIGIIHSDLKPENILLENDSSISIKLIDFGSACLLHNKIYTYIQTRFYRSPEVILGISYTQAIDMWSLGCIIAELFIGLPLFPGVNQYDQLSRIIQMIGKIPDEMLKQGSETGKYFNYIDGEFKLKSPEQFSRENRTQNKKTSKYFNYNTLPEIIYNIQTPQNATEEELEKDKKKKTVLIDLLQGLLRTDPKKRWTPKEALQHPLFTGEELTKPFKPKRMRKRKYYPSKLVKKEIYEKKLLEQKLNFRKNLVSSYEYPKNKTDWGLGTSPTLGSYGETYQQRKFGSEGSFSTMYQNNFNNSFQSGNRIRYGNNYNNNTNNNNSLSNIEQLTNINLNNNNNNNFKQNSNINTINLNNNNNNNNNNTQINNNNNNYNQNMNYNNQTNNQNNNSNYINNNTNMHLFNNNNNSLNNSYNISLNSSYNNNNNSLNNSYNNNSLNNSYNNNNSLNNSYNIKLNNSYNNNNSLNGSYNNNSLNSSYNNNQNTNYNYTNNSNNYFNLSFDQNINSQRFNLSYQENLNNYQQQNNCFDIRALSQGRSLDNHPVLSFSNISSKSKSKKKKRRKHSHSSKKKHSSQKEKNHNHHHRHHHKRRNHSKSNSISKNEKNISSKTEKEIKPQSHSHSHSHTHTHTHTHTHSQSQTQAIKIRTKRRKKKKKKKYTPKSVTDQFLKMSLKTKRFDSDN
ncbi:homeodomain interacting protein kinase [Anaeramoeba flamelloides]|uniref:Homeodomain interacting protein kinase n=1 Tax=Anaeramoeba flamelloides TaxID=1746091 RepID=A0ABQ8Y966_9EUKA|nr:homeodomain interacting protein kinase [Anaeramoeba flamelloides]